MLHRSRPSRTLVRCSAAKFNGVYSLDLYFPSNHGADHTTITFIGLRGEFTERRRQAVEAVYEAKPMPKVWGRCWTAWRVHGPPCTGSCSCYCYYGAREKAGALESGPGRAALVAACARLAGQCVRPTQTYESPNPLTRMQDHQVPEDQRQGWNLGM